MVKFKGFKARPIPEDHKALLKLHYGVSFNNDSDSESVGSAFSNDSSLEKYRPQPYSYEEIQSRVMVVKPGPSSSKLVNNVKQSLCNPIDSKEKKLKNLMKPEYCHVCQAKLVNPHNAQCHYRSQRHEFSVTEQFGKELFKKSKNFYKNMITNNMKYKSSETLNQPSSDIIKTNVNNEVDDIFKTKLKSLMQPFYCHVCPANLSTPNDAMSHYGSERHAKKVEDLYALEKKNRSTNSDENNFNKVITDNSIDTVNSSCNSKEVEIKQHQDETEKVSKELLQPYYCHICKTDLLQPYDAVSHYSSKRHADWSRSWCTAENVAKCFISRNNTNSSTALLESLIKVGKSNVKLAVVDLLNGSPVQMFHDDLTKHFRDDLRQQLLELLTDAACHVCKTFFEDIDRATSHYISKRHIQNVELWCEKKFNEQAEPLGSEDLHSSPSSSLKMVSTSSTTLYCYLCKTTFYTKDSLDQHVLSFVHQELLKLVTILVKKEIPLQDYWFKLFKKLVKTEGCDLCHKKFSTNNMAISHSNSEYHRNEVKYWISQYRDYAFVDAPKAFDKQVCYCEVCGKDLDGTSRADAHYIGNCHKTCLKTYCHACKLQTDTTKGYEDHLNSSSHIRKLLSTAVSTVQNNEIETKSNVQTSSECNNNLKLKQDSLFNALNKNASNLDKEVLKELKKLEDTIYHSKKIPLEVALQYLLKFNNELDELKSKFEKDSETKTTENNTQQEVSKVKLVRKELDCAKTESTDLEEIKPKNNVSKKNDMKQTESCKENKTVSNYNNFKDDQTIRSVIPKECKKDDLIEASYKKIVAQDKLKAKTNQSPEITIVKNKNINNMEEKNDASKENSAKSNIFKPKNSNSSDYVPKTNEILCDETTKNALENNVLIELNKFVDSVSDGVLENSVILTCLKNFNKELEDYLKDNLKDHGESKRNQEMLEDISNQTSNIDKLFDKITAYIPENENACENIEEEFKLESDDCKNDNIVQDKIFNKKFDDKGDNEKTKKDTLLEILKYEQELFKTYYEDENYEQFRDFRDLYLQGSIKKSSCNKILMENTVYQNDDCKYNFDKADNAKSIKDNFLEMLKYEQEIIKTYYEDENYENFREFKDTYLCGSLEKSSDNKILVDNTAHQNDDGYKNDAICQKKTVDNKTVNEKVKNNNFLENMKHDQDLFKTYYEDENYQNFTVFRDQYFQGSLAKKYDGYKSDAICQTVYRTENKMFNKHFDHKADNKNTKKDNFLEIMKYEVEIIKTYYEDENYENFREFKDLYFYGSLEKSSGKKKLLENTADQNYNDCKKNYAICQEKTELVEKPLGKVSSCDLSETVLIINEAPNSKKKRNRRAKKKNFVSKDYLNDIGEYQTNNNDKLCDKVTAHTTENEIAYKNFEDTVDNFNATTDNFLEIMKFKLEKFKTYYGDENFREFRKLYSNESSKKSLVNKISMNNIDHQNGDDCENNNIAQNKIFNQNFDDTADKEKNKKDTLLEYMKYEQELFKIYYEDENYEQFREFQNLYLQGSIKKSFCNKILLENYAYQNDCCKNNVICQKKTAHGPGNKIVNENFHDKADNAKDNRYNFLEILKDEQEITKTYYEDENYENFQEGRMENSAHQNHAICETVHRTENKMFNENLDDKSDNEKTKKDNFLEIMKYEQEIIKTYHEDENYENFREFKDVYLYGSLEKSSGNKILAKNTAHQNDDGYENDAIFQKETSKTLSSKKKRNRRAKKKNCVSKDSKPTTF